MGFVIVPFTLESELAPIILAWKEAFSQPPSSARSLHELTDQLQWHSTFPGFVGLIARDADTDRVLGLVYGFSNQPGQWWRDRVAEAIGPAQTQTLLTDSFCLMELGVVRAARRHGVAQALVNGLWAQHAHAWMVLSMQSDNRHASAFYRATGWSSVIERMSFGLGFLPYDILALPAALGTSSP